MHIPDLEICWRGIDEGAFIGMANVSDASIPLHIKSFQDLLLPFSIRDPFIMVS
jgi:hypothetical protein